MMMNKTSVFKSSESRDAIRNAYGEILSRFPFGQTYIDTTYGKTFILSAGADGNPPVILLHGSCSNSVFWLPEIMALSHSHSVFAVDIIGEAGNSSDSRPDLQSDVYALWLKEVLNALRLREAVIIGNSLGGWLALKFAATFPECVSKLILIAASGLSYQKTELLEKAIHAKSSNETLTMEASVTGGMELPKEVLDFINLILWGYNPITEMLPVFSDEQLKKLAMPVLFVAGKNDVMVDTASASQRLASLLPHTNIHLLDNAGHMVPNALEYIVPFLIREDTP
jgi:pimeloyl-ACP methyl ester carboxylesterase